MTDDLWALSSSWAFRGDLGPGKSTSALFSTEIERQPTSGDFLALSQMSAATYLGRLLRLEAS